ncbi:MAG: hypothetical protein R3Y57_00750 [Erysipelotrichaceae bacterium]
MQLTIYQKLNQLLLVYILLSALIIVGIVYKRELLEGYMTSIIFAFFIVNILFYFGFKFLEINLDKYYIQKMAIDNKLAIANIKTAEPYMIIKDSSMKKYRLWEISAELIDHDLNKKEIVFYEKGNLYMETIPNGTIFVTYDKNKPLRIFAVPNNMISHCNDFAPYVAEYEMNKGIHIKYLNVYHNAGIVIETYADTLNQSKI